MLNRRTFIKSTLSLSLLSFIESRKLIGKNLILKDDTKPLTNIKDALKYERTINSIPGLYPGKVVKIYDKDSISDNKIVYDVAYEMVDKGIRRLTDLDNLEQAWKKFINKNDIIGIKVNPVAGKQLSTSLEITRAIIKQLIEVGIPKENIIIWDRRGFELKEVGFDEEHFPEVKIKGTEIKDSKGSFYDANKKLYSEDLIDKDWYYWADCEEKYDEETLPYMINEGKYSYFTKIVTKDIDKIINVPILKNAGSSITCCLKNLAYGSISNTGRLHKQLWGETSAEVCAFPPLRDKLVLNIVDGLIGCFQGGPGADQKYIIPFNTLLFGTDPVAVDRIGYEIILKKRIEENIQKQESQRGRKFLDLAQELKLGIADLDKINLIEI